MVEKYLISYEGEKGALYRDYTKALNELGFVLEKPIVLANLEHDVGRFEFTGSDAEEATRKVLTLDEKMRIEHLKQITAKQD
jgi:hypothetical protein